VVLCNASSSLFDICVLYEGSDSCYMLQLVGMILHSVLSVLQWCQLLPVSWKCSKNTFRRYAHGCLIKIQSVRGWNVHQDSTVGTVMYCGLGSLGIESDWDKIVHTWTDWPRGLPNHLCSGYWVIPGVKRLGHGIKHPTLFSAEEE